MLKYITTRFRITVTLCTLLILSPAIAQAVTDEDFAAMRAQMAALSARLDQLESENRALTAANAELAKLEFRVLLIAGSNHFSNEGNFIANKR